MGITDAAPGTAPGTTATATDAVAQAPFAPFAPFASFEEAARSVLAHLRARHPMGAWLVTRTIGEDRIALVADDEHYGLEQGAVFRWSDTRCARTDRGTGPGIARRADAIPAYVAAGLGRLLPVGAYVRAPLVRRDGSLFGALCALDPDPRGDGSREAQTDAALCARLLVTLLEHEQAADDDRRAAQRRSLRTRARTDPRSGVADRRAWEDVLDAEEERCRRWADPAGVIVVGLDAPGSGDGDPDDGAGRSDDLLLLTTASVLCTTVRPVDLVARLDEDEFGVLAPGVTGDGLAELTDRVTRHLTAAGLPVSVGHAPRDPRGDLQLAWRRARRSLGTDRRRRRAARSAAPVVAG